MLFRSEPYSQISPYTGSADYTLITPRYWISLVQSHLPGENATQFSVSVAMHTVPIVSSTNGTHYCWVDRARGHVNSKLVQGFYT